MADRQSPSTTDSTAESIAAPRYPLQRKVILWTVLMISVGAFSCAIVLNGIARDAMTRSHGMYARAVSQTLASAVSGRLRDSSLDRFRELVDSVGQAPRFAFVEVVDARGDPLHRLLNDAVAWQEFEVWRQAQRGSLPVLMTDALFLGDAREVAVFRAPIVSRLPETVTTRDLTHRIDDRRVEGFVVVALRDLTLPDTSERLQAAMMVVVGVICLISVPVIAWFTSRWSKPVRQLNEAVHSFGRGERPRAVPVETRDELGQLADSFNDVTERLWQTRQELRRANEQLEHQVRQRTAELERVNERLGAELRDKDKFMRAVTHDLNAPLRNIGGMTELLLIKYKTEFADDAVTKLERIAANVKVQTDLIDDLMELSRIRTKPARREEVDIEVVVRELGEQMAYDLEAKGISLMVLAPLPTVFASRNRVQQVFQNLLDNAVKYMLDSSDPRIMIGFENDGRELHFWVADTGCGIADVDLPHVTQIFRRAAHSGTHNVPGRGVGLATVQSIVETYGGRLWIESEDGSGTTVHITFDAHLVGQEQPASEPAEALSDDAK